MLFDFLLFEKMNHRNCIKFYVKKNKIKCSRTFEILTVAFGESTITKKGVQLRHNQFKEGQEDINNDSCLGLQSKSTTDKNIEAVKK